MNAEILCVGTELLLGATVNTNAAWLARELAALGIGCYYQSVVGDNPARLRDSLALAFSRADMVVTTGGLGPTYDDLTKETVAAYFNRPMEMHAESLGRIRAFFQTIGHPMTENNEKQALMPQGAVVFPNERGTAPGLALEGHGKIALMLPGPPREMTAMFDSGVRPYLRAKSSTVLVSHNIHFFGIGESTLESQLKEYMEASANPTVAPYAKSGEVMLRVTASAPCPEEAEALLTPVVAELQQRYADYVYGIDVGSLENALVSILLEQGLSLAVIEHFSGGLLARRLQQAPGADQVFLGGISTPASPGLLLPSLTVLDPANAAYASAAASAVRAATGADIGLVVSALAHTGEDDKASLSIAVVLAPFLDAQGQENTFVKSLNLSGQGERIRQDPDYIRHYVASEALYLAKGALAGL